MKSPPASGRKPDQFGEPKGRETCHRGKPLMSPPETSHSENLGQIPDVSNPELEEISKEFAVSYGLSLTHP